jgi:regulator of sigma E protease
MNDILLYTGLLILSLSILVFWHELGHYLPAKWFGMKVEKFYLFFDWPRKLFSKNVGETEYGVGLLPLGGYVKIAGMIDESLDKNQLAEPAQPWEFRSKPAWQRLIVMVGGVVMNIILGIFIFTIVKYTRGEERLPMASLPAGIFVPDSSVSEELGFKTGDKIMSFSGQPIKYFEDIAHPGILLNDSVWFEVDRQGTTIRIDIPGDLIDQFANKGKAAGMLFYPNAENWVVVDSTMPAAKAGVQNGDQVIEIEGKPIYYFEELRATIKNRTDDSIALVWLRNQDTMRATIVLGSEGLLGLAPEDRFKRDKIEYGFFAAFVPGTKVAFGVIFDTFKGFRKIFKGEVSASNSVAGPVRIAGMIGVNFQRDGWLGFWMLTGMLSMALAFMNILPIPALDGGHVVFLLIEMIIRREPSLKVRMIAQQVGMIILLALMAFVIFNDIIATVFK